MLDPLQFYCQVLCNGMKTRFRMVMIAHPGPGIRFHKRFMWQIIIPPTTTWLYVAHQTWRSSERWTVSSIAHNRLPCMFHNCLVDTLTWTTSSSQHSATLTFSKFSFHMILHVSGGKRYGITTPPFHHQFNWTKTGQRLCSLSPSSTFKATRKNVKQSIPWILYQELDTPMGRLWK